MLRILFDEITWIRFIGSWIQVGQFFGIITFLFLLCFSSHPSSLDLPPVIYGLSLLYLITLVPSIFQDDIHGDYLTWIRTNLQSSNIVLVSYFGSKILTSYILYVCPILFLNLLLIHSLNLDQIGLYTLSFSLSAGITLCWASLFQLLFENGLANQYSLSLSSLLSLLTIPLLIPTLLVSIECLKAIVMGEYCGYYLGMQGGLFLATLAATLTLSPFIINQIEHSP